MSQRDSNVKVFDVLVSLNVVGLLVISKLVIGLRIEKNLIIKCHKACWYVRICFSKVINVFSYNYSEM